jgi:DNA-binding response OmpR family regulator
VLCVCVKERGAHPVCAKSLDEALSHAHAGVALIVIEEGFAGLGQLQALKRLRAVSAAPALVVSEDGEAVTPLKVEGFGLGAQGVLAKPLTREKFLSAAHPHLA